MTWPLIVLIVGQSLDLSSTLIKRHEGCRESNPVLSQRPLTIAVVKGGATATITWAFAKHVPKPKPAATWVPVTIGAIGAGLAVHNMMIDCQPGRR